MQHQSNRVISCRLLDIVLLLLGVLHNSQESDMILHDYSDAAYLVAKGARSRAAGYVYLGNDTNNKQLINGPISIIAK